MNNSAVKACCGKAGVVIEVANEEDSSNYNIGPRTSHKLATTNIRDEINMPVYAC